MNQISAALLALFIVCLGATRVRSSELLIEAESFDDHGGWKLDTQFINHMGSPYLLAHGLGKPVADAMTRIQIQQAGEYTVWARTFDWVARWDAPGKPGRFQIKVDGQPVGEEVGTDGRVWQWQKAGSIQLTKGEHSLSIQDLTGFDGRCDAIYLTTDAHAQPDNSSEILSPFRRKLLGIDAPVEIRSEYDLVVIGGGYSGMGAAISAARMGCKVALIQNRGVLGGNGSSEVRVWSMGYIRRGKFPRIGEIIEEFADSATKSPGRAEEFGDDLKEQVVRAEKNIDLFLHHHAFRVKADDQRIHYVDAIDTRTSAVRRFQGGLFSDCTGHGTIGMLANADWEITPVGRMGMSNMWRWDEVDQPTSFPETPWALQLNMADFPYPRDHHGQWFWESGFDKDPIGDAEGIRDWNLRAVYGAFNAMKNGDGAADHRNAILTWIAYVGGPRESRRLLGDVILTQDDVVTKREFPDGCVPSTWTIDLHYPKKQFAQKFPDNPFISIAEHDRRIDRQYGYPVPYRCFYSRNLSNMFMAGRCISVTHEALGTVRVMKTCGMMGEVVGKAASLCVQYDCSPRDVYQDHLSELTQLLDLPGKARRDSVGGPISIPEDALPRAGKFGPETGKKMRELAGVAVDDDQAELIGKWTRGQGLKGYVGYGYRYASENSGAKARFTLKAIQAGKHDVRIAWLPHENRGAQVPIQVQRGSQVVHTARVNMKQRAGEDDFAQLVTVDLRAGEEIIVQVGSDDSHGTVHVDCVQMLPTK